MGNRGSLAFDRQLCVALHKASRAVSACYRPMLAEVGLTYSQYTVMLVLWEREHTTQKEIGSMLDLDSGTLSPLLKRMEKLGLLTRSRHDDDERVLSVSITDHGRGLRHRVNGIQGLVETQTGLSDADLTQLRDDLTVLTERMQSRA